MNGTANQGSLVGAFSYLNQTAHSLVPETVIFSSLINYPYRIALSVLNATRLQYEQAVASDELIPSLESVVDTIGYFFSSYAVASFVTALILNRFVIMASLRSNTARTSLPLWSKFVLHLSALVPLFYNVIQTLNQVGIIEVFPAMGFPFYLARTFTIFAWSHCVETFITTTTNSKPLEESDYTIFELSVQFYYLSQRNLYLTMAPEYLSDCLMALLGRIWIHIVEMFNLRKHRLAGSTVLNITNIIFLIYQVKTHGFDSIPVSTRYRHFPKIFSLFLIVMSVATYALACLVRKNPFGNQEYDTKELQFHSFMHNWWNHLNCTGEEEFSHVVNKLALLLCNGNESMNRGIHREYSSLNNPADIHRSYMISGYLNKVSTIPDDMDQKDPGTDKQLQRLGAPSIISKLKISYSLVKAAFTFFFKRKWLEKRQVQEKSANTNRSERSRDLNKFITERNYARFLTKPESDRNHGEETPLLPEEDYSEDYLPDFETSEDESETDTIGPDNSEEQAEEMLLSTTAPKEMEWFMAIWPILKVQLAEDRRLTRSQYAASSPADIIAEVVSQKRQCASATAGSTDEDMLGDNDEEDSRSNCVVCRINPRNIVLWPCTCFALCEECRISLGLRGFNSCVCCRTEIHGYSRLNNV
ncbi:hypothetical protein HG536_0A03500 [Torulaspora globosa]|uniref:RING-type domain-containing protein n=1 Tax=Torulaspora globosa TaxID=48254 RepID=A0A7G3ZAJ6_9SACH|nr:uncharacterized protein HG536_0A03500 [Torulaspora globosa]QLL30532.1 hypothetical protein HG536_0A03500 [Torulaspora globosa]